MFTSALVECRPSRVFPVALAMAVVVGLGLSQRSSSDDGTADGAVRGRVVTADGARTPVARARVTVGATDRPVADPVFTDAEGWFTVPVRPAGALRLRVAKAGFAPRDIEHDSTGPLVIPMVRGAVIAGQVVDAFGDPASQTVFLRREDPPGSEPVEVSRTSDDRGEFRFGNLPAGRYGLYFEPRLPPVFGTTPLVVPGTGSAARAMVEVRPGEEARVTLAHAPRPGIFALTLGAGTGLRAGGISRDGGGRASVSGHVREADGRPVGAASVVLEPVDGGLGYSTTTGSDGRYVLERLPAGTFRLVAVKNGFMATEYGWTLTPQHGRTFTIGDGQRLDARDVVLPRTAAITGTVLDEHGAPVDGLSIYVWEPGFDSDRVTLAQPATGWAAMTDDLGRYRIHGLSPGTYYVSAAPPGMPWRRLYYPGRLLAADAAPVQVDVGIDAARTDFVFHHDAWRTLPRLAGRAIDAFGAPLVGTASLTTRYRPGGLTAPPLGARIADDGLFEFREVPPGDYVVHVLQVGLQAFPRGFGRAFVTVSEDGAPPVVVRVSNGASIHGRIVLEGDATSVSPSDFRLAVITADPEFVPAPVGAVPWALITRDDIAFEMGGLTGATRFIAARAPEGWWLKSVEIDGVNAAVDPVLFDRGEAPRRDVRAVFSDATTTISGSVRDEWQQPSRAYAVVAFSTDRSHWFHHSPFLRLIRSGTAGGFSIASLPPGEYWVAAVDSIDGNATGGAWQQPAMLDRLTASARRVSAGERQRVTVELRLTRLPR